jgi:hypothetical protein
MVTIFTNANIMMEATKKYAIMNLYFLMVMDLDVEASEMAISYDGLWNKLIDKK